MFFYSQLQNGYMSARIANVLEMTVWQLAWDMGMCFCASDMYGMELQSVCYVICCGYVGWFTSLSCDMVWPCPNRISVISF